MNEDHLTDQELLALQADLDDLERTDPIVGAAAESYDRMVERITGRPLPPREAIEPITDHPYRADRQGQWHTGRCDLCGEVKSAHITCTCHVRSDAIGPHVRGCPNHPEAARPS